MRHLNRVKKLNRTKSHRKALLKNLANALLNHERIKTTSPKALELKKVTDRLITLAKRKDMHSMRLAFGMLRDKEMVRKLFTDIGERYGAVNGGYTRVLKIGNRKGDNAPMSIIELTMRKEKEEKKAAEKETKAKETKAKETKAKETKAAKAPKTAKKEAKAEKEPAAKKEKAVKKETKTKKEAKVETTEEPKPKRTRKKKEEAVEAGAEAKVESAEETKEDQA